MSDIANKTDLFNFKNRIAVKWMARDLDMLPGLMTNSYHSLLESGLTRQQLAWLENVLNGMIEQWPNKYADVE